MFGRRSAEKRNKKPAKSEQPDAVQAKADDEVGRPMWGNFDADGNPIDMTEFPETGDPVDEAPEEESEMPESLWIGHKKQREIEDQQKRDEQRPHAPVPEFDPSEQARWEEEQRRKREEENKK